MFKKRKDRPFVLHLKKGEKPVEIPKEKYLEAIDSAEKLIFKQDEK